MKSGLLFVTQKLNHLIESSRLADNGVLSEFLLIVSAVQFKNSLPDPTNNLALNAILASDDRLKCCSQKICTY